MWKAIEVLSAVAQTLAAPDDFERIAPRILCHLCDGLSCDVGVLWVVDGDRDVLRAEWIWHGQERGAADLAAGLRRTALARGAGLAGRAWVDGEPCWPGDDRQDPAVPGGAEELRGMLCLPCRSAETVHGAIELFGRDPGATDADMRAALVAIAGICGRLLENRARIKALTESNDRLRALVEAAPVPIIAVGGENRVLLYNKAAERAFGLPIDEALEVAAPQGDAAAASPEGQGGIASYPCLLDQLLVRRQGFSDVTVRRRGEDGLPLHLRLSGAPFGDAGDQPAGVVTAQDVTETIRFLQVAAHELRNPMASVKGIASLLRRNVVGGRPAEDLIPLCEIIEDEVDRLASLLNQVLEAFRTHAGQPEPERKPVDLLEVLSAAVRPFAASAEHHRYILSDTVGKPVRVLGDARRLEDVVRNLLSNARKYSPDGGDVWVTLGATPSEACISVRNRGIGIPDGELPRVFEPFYRASNLSGRDPGGLGLGLAICKQIVRLHGGRIWAEAGEGGDTIFHVALPLAAE